MLFIFLVVLNDNVVIKMPNVLEPKYPSAMRQFLKLKFVQSRTILFMP